MPRFLNSLLRRIDSLPKWYLKNYKICELFCCLIFPLSVLIFLINLPVPSYWFVLGFIVFFLIALIWSVILASVMGKLLLVLSLISGITVHIDKMSVYAAYVVVGLLFFLLLMRLILLWYLPASKNLITTWATRMELRNQGVAPSEMELTELLEAGQGELAVRTIVAGYKDVNSWDDKGRTPLIIAAEMGMYRILDRLISLGGDLELPGSHKYQDKTALTIAIDYQNTALIELIIQKMRQMSKKYDHNLILEYLKYAVKIGKYNSVRTILKELEDQNDVDDEHPEESSPELIVYDYDEFLQQNILTEAVPPKLDLENNYLRLLKAFPVFWTDKFRKLWSESVTINSQFSGYLYVAKPYNFVYKADTYIQTYVEGDADVDKTEMVSLPVGILRLADLLESRLGESFVVPQSEQITIPMKRESITCTKCQGAKKLPCPSGCVNGQLMCKKPECREGKIVCPDCQGTGKETCVCPDCKDGYKNCVHCQGMGYFACEYCTGTGKQVVDIMEECSCDRAQKTNCLECDGTGYQDGYLCMTCKGEGVVCKVCNNTGKKKSGTQETQDCSQCQGTGIAEYCHCNSGLIPCSNCDRTATVVRNCQTCIGEGKVVCPECRGTGWESCFRCQGKGFLVCDKCQGHGSLAQITFCQLTYEQNSMGQAPRIYTPEDNAYQKVFHDYDGDGIFSHFCGKTQQYRIIVHQQEEKIHKKREEITGDGALKEERFKQLITNLLVTEEPYNSSRFIMKGLDILMIKYDIIDLSDGERIVLFNESSYSINDS